MLQVVDIIAQTWPKEGQIRRLHIHEYQSQKLLQDFGVPVPQGKVARTATEARAAALEIGHDCFVKAQVLGGGRANGEFENGLRGGVQAVANPELAESVASKMLGHRFHTKCPANKSLTVSEVYVVESVNLDAEWYLAMTIDREHYRPSIVISKMGGFDIDIIARDNPQALFTFNFGLSEGITEDLVSMISGQLKLTPREMQSLKHILERIYEIFVQKDATLLEINPLAHSADGTLTCLNSSFTFDNSAAGRQPEIFALRDHSQEVPDELEAETHGLLYVKLDGNIGNVVNGAGLAMATNDAIGFEGGVSSNFLDAGGKATKETMQRAIGIVIRDDRVRAILVNVYGGITRCDMIAESIIGATRELDIRLPMVVRLQGTNSEKGLQLLKQANLGIHVEADFGRAAQRVVELAKSVTEGRVDRL